MKTEKREKRGKGGLGEFLLLNFIILTCSMYHISSPYL